MSEGKRIIEKTLAIASFVVAVALVFFSLVIREEHDLTANICLAIAQFLTLTATLLGLELKFGTHAKNNGNNSALQ